MAAKSRLLPAALFGLRTAASAMLALYLAFRLQLDEPAWAATSAVIMTNPILGATLRRGALRLVGTLVGAAAAVVLLAAFPQDRVGFLLGLAIWGGLCSAAATLVGELRSYAPLLAGYTCAIVAMSAVADPPTVLLIAIARGSCIALGIIVTTLVFSLTEFGDARERLARIIELATTEAVSGLRAALSGPSVDLDAGQAARRALIARAAMMDAVVDQAVGENLDLRSRVGVLRRAVAGVFVVLSSWRGVEQHRRRADASAEATAAAAVVARRLEVVLARADPSPTGLRRAAREMEGEVVADISPRLLLDRAAHGLNGLAAARAGLSLLRDPLHAGAEPGLPPTRLPEPLLALQNGLRSAVTVAVAAAIWVATGWPYGPSFVIFAMVVVVLFSTSGEAAFGAATGMAISATLGLILAAVIRFVAMPFAQGQGFDGFASLCVVLGVPLALLGALGVLLPRGGTPSLLAFATMAMLLPLLSPTNDITYDLGGFLNSSLATVAGAILGTAAHRLWPPLPRWLRVRLLLRATRRDLRRIARGSWRPDHYRWEARQYARLVAMPPGWPFVDFARLLAALSVGRELLRRQGEEGADPTRRRAADVELAEAAASHPEFLAGLELTPRRVPQREDG
jgi:uncharacterized membrane protein YccC